MMPEAHSSEVLLEARDLEKTYFVKHGSVRAVDGVNLSLKRGATLGVVGESGCGKSTLARLLMRLVNPTAGQVILNGEDIAGLSRRQMRQRRRQIQMIFQDPFSALNPRMRVDEIISEPWSIFPGVVARKDRADRVGDLLEQVGLARRDAKRHPHQFSGGQRQRIGIARALALKPEIIVCDEPVSALDVSVQAQVVNLLEELQDTLGLSYVFIAHDLSIVRHICDRVAVMYLGKIVEIGSYDRIFDAPAHPYTQALLSTVPSIDPAQRAKRIILEGEVPSPLNPPSGCRFRTRCRKAQAICAEKEPSLDGPAIGDHKAACHFAEFEGAMS